MIKLCLEINNRYLKYINLYFLNSLYEISIVFKISFSGTYIFKSCVDLSIHRDFPGRKVLDNSYI